MTQPPLDFTRTHTHRSDPETSREAARAQVPKYTAACWTVLEYLQRHPEGRTDYEGERDTIYSYRRRRADLYAEGDVEPSAQKRPNPETGCDMIVWRLTDQGMSRRRPE